MRFIKKNFWTMLAMIFVITLSFAGDAFAGQQFMGTVSNKLVALFKATKLVVFILGGFGLIAVAFLAIFGKLQWKWFAGLACGLAILAAAGMAITYVTGDVGNYASTGQLGDTFGQAG